MQKVILIIAQHFIKIEDLQFKENSNTKIRNKLHKEEIIDNSNKKIRNNLYKEEMTDN